MADQNGPRDPATPEEIWNILRKAAEIRNGPTRCCSGSARRPTAGQENDRRMQETDRQMQETDRQMQETDLRLRKLR